MKKIITSPHNLKIKQALKLRKTSNRQKENLIIIEGSKEINYAVNAGFVIQELFYCPDLDKAQIKPDSIMSRSVTELSSAVFKKISYREHPDGFLALAVPRYLKLNEIVLPDNPLLAVLESVEKPGNLGAVLRSAEAAQADAVIVCDPRTDIYNPNVIRASLGAIFMVPVVVISTEEAIAWLKQKRIKSFAAAPKAKLLHTEADLSVGAAIIVGTEHEGLSKAWLDGADEKIKIPMKGRLDSLNASVSAAIILYEAIRQRKNN